MHEPFGGESEMGALMRAVDWSKTPLGPVESWSLSLRMMVGFLLANRFPLLLWWGPTFCSIYNDAYRPILGTKHPWALGRPVSECWSEIWHVLEPLIETPFRGGPATWIEDFMLEINRHDFVEETHFTVAYSPVPDDSVAGGIGGVLATVHEISEKVVGERRTTVLRDLGARSAEAKTADEACVMAAEMLERHAQDVPFALFYLIDPDRKKARLAATSGIRAGEARGSLEIPLDQEESVPWPLAAVLRTGDWQLVEDLGPRFNQVPAGPWSEPPRAAAVLPIRSNVAHQLAGFLVVGLSVRLRLDEQYRRFLDLVSTQIATAIANARAYELERQRAEALLEIDRAKTAFFSNVSHEFRTPLTLMLGPMEDALRGSERTLGAENLETAYRNALRLLKLVNALLDFSRIEAGRVEARFEPTDLPALTRDLASAFRASVERAGLTLVVRSDQLAEPVYVDREMWEKIVLNLLSNAFKFTFEGEIELALRSSPGVVELSVRDTGTGISARELPRLFERFHRVEGAKARTHEGSGIGLALVQELVRMHGGSIRAESEVGMGTTMFVTLRTGADHLPKDRIGEREVRSDMQSLASVYIEESARWLVADVSARPLEARTPDDAESRARILVVDDNADMRGYLARLLSERWEVEAASDGEAALELLGSRPFSLILTDVMMPRLDGFGLLRAVKSDPRWATIPVVMVSARAGEESRIEGREAGADDYLIKPFSARELLARVSSQLVIAESAKERTRSAIREAAALREAALQREHLLALFTDAPTPIAILRGPEYLFELANRHTCRLFGRTEEQLIQKPLLEAIPELRGHAFKDLLDGVRSTGVPYVGTETPASVDRRGDGHFETAYFNFVYSPLRDVNGAIDGVLVMAFDVTDEVVARAQTDRLRLAAESATRAKDAFMAMLGHELRNPLSPMLTSIQLMRLRGMQSQELDVLDRQVHHLIRLVDDLMDIARITSGKVELRRKRIELAQVIVRALETSSPLLEKRRQSVDVRVPVMGLGIDADPERLTQVFSNLLTNASKYSEPGSAITIVAERVGDRIQAMVKDEGAGIAPELAECVFDLFVQQPQTLERATGGLGLGLAIVRNLVEMHGGTVSVRSEGIGRGSEFFVHLPAAELVRGGGDEDPPGVQRPTNKGRTQRILVVDDNEDAAEMLKYALETLGHVVEVAHDAPAALERTKGFVPNIAILDIGLPVMDGFELAQRLKDLQSSPEIHLVALTGYGHEADRERSRIVGFRQHLIKPVDIAELQRVIVKCSGS